ncbi:hypothetical protein pb186bvf_019717 [Paramecium bursaria]
MKPMFQNPFADGIADQQEEIKESMIQLESKQEKKNEMNMEQVHKIKKHVINHKLKDDFHQVLQKYFVRIWREQVLKLKMNDDQNKVEQEQTHNLGEEILKNQMYQKLKLVEPEEQEIESEEEQEQQMQTSFLIKAHNKKPSNMGGESNPQDDGSLFQMPGQDLLMQRLILQQIQIIQNIFK